MGTVTYKNQPGTAKVLKQGTPLAGTSHVYRVGKILWPDAVEKFIEGELVGTSLHVCCGKSLIGDVRVDLYEEGEGIIKADAAKLPFPDKSFDTVFCDPPYNGKFQWNHDMLSEMFRVARKRIIFQHWYLPADNKGQYKKCHDFKLSAVYVWQPRTYFGRVQVVSVFDTEAHLSQDEGVLQLGESSCPAIPNELSI